MRFYLFLAFISILASCTPIAQSSTNSGSNQKVLRLADATYEPQIKTIRVIPPGSPTFPAVAPLNNQRLILEFDDLTSERDNYYVRYIHCNYDWTESALQDLDFLTAYNEFPINTAEFSVDTHVPYVRYSFPLPPVKLPGNYVLIVYREGNKDDIILSKRFMIYDSQVTFLRNENLVGPGGIARKNQQINFTVNYQNVNILNPSLIGYGIDDYQNLLKYFLRKKDFFKIEKIIICFCLNDVYVGRIDQIQEPGGKLRDKFSSLLNFLRSNSRLFLFIKKNFSDRPKDYYLFDEKFYKKSNESFKLTLNIISNMNKIAELNNIKLYFVMFPYEYQLRTNNFKPQNILHKELNKMNINFESIKFDLQKFNSEEFYLYGDGIHFNNSGHKFIANYLLNYFN